MPNIVSQNANIGARIGVIPTVYLTEGLTTVGILALLPLPLEAALVLLPVIGIALNGTSSVVYGSVPALVAPEKRTRAFSIFYTGTIGSGAISPALFGFVGDLLSVHTSMITVAYSCSANSIFARCYSFGSPDSTCRMPARTASRSASLMSARKAVS